LSYAVMTFHTTSAAFRAESVLRGAGFECKLIPTPRKLSTDCGVALRFDLLEIDDVKSAVEKASILIMTVQPISS
jgi:hypothetical protein